MVLILKLALWTGAIIQLEKCNHPSFISQLFLFSSQPRVVDTAGPPSPHNGAVPDSKVGQKTNLISIYYHETQSLGPGLFTLSFVPSALKACDP